MTKIRYIRFPIFTILFTIFEYTQFSVYDYFVWFFISEKFLEVATFTITKTLEIENLKIAATLFTLYGYHRYAHVTSNSNVQ